MQQFQVEYPENFSLGKKNCSLGSVLLPNKTYTQIVKIAFSTGVSAGVLIRYWLWQFVDELADEYLENKDITHQKYHQPKIPIGMTQRNYMTSNVVDKEYKLLAFLLATSVSHLKRTALESGSIKMLTDIEVGSPPAFETFFRPIPGGPVAETSVRYIEDADTIVYPKTGNTLTYCEVAHIDEPRERVMQLGKA